MTAAKLEVSVELSTIECGVCGGVYAILERRRKQCQMNGESWTCPYCKTGWGFAGNSDNEKLKREIEAEKARTQAALARANDAIAALALREKELKRHKARIKDGVCPCCQRSFVALARHMKAKHPEYTA